MSKEGVIKFNCDFIQSAPLNLSLLEEINIYRQKLYNKELIGETEDGIGFGNISVRYAKNSFIISGSGTGSIKELTNEHYSIVIDFNIDSNSITATGPVIASSESLTHAIIYALQTTTNAVIHVHHSALWKYLLQKVPSTSAAVEYGTVAMAYEVERLFKESNLSETKIFAMGGHTDGVIAFGETCDEAYTILLQHLHSLNKK